MSQYVILVRTDSLLPLPRFALTTSNNPATGLAILQNCSPVKLALMHSIHTANRTEVVERTLQIKYRTRLHHGFWYDLTPQDVADICALNESNFQNMIGLIQKSLVKPSLSETETKALIAEALQQAEAALI